MKTVLLAYERDQDLAAVESVLQSRGHRVVKARTGLEALEAIRHDTPDAVVSDVQLPRLDGFSLCRRLREDPAYLHLPFVLHSFRVEGTKYEAFAAEVGAQRFVPRGSALEDIAAVLDDSASGSGTQRLPALVPGLLDRQEQDRRRLADLERQLREAEARNQQLTVAERVARERAEREARARSDFAAAESVRIRELQVRIRDLETAHRQAAEAESQARDALARNRADDAALATLEATVAEAHAATAHAQALVHDLERAFAAQPTPVWIVEAESNAVVGATDAGAALVGVEPDALRGCSFVDVMPAAEFADPAVREATVAWARPDGTVAQLELQRRPVTHDGRACWLVTARDVSAERAAEARLVSLAPHAEALKAAPEACALVDADGRLRYGNDAMLALLQTDAERLSAMTLQSLACEERADSTLRMALSGQDSLRQQVRWRRADGALLDVEVTAAACDATGAIRVITVRDVSAERANAERSARDHERVSRLLELAQSAHGLTEAELLERAVQLAQDLTHSPIACAFLAVGNTTSVELAARKGGEPATGPAAIFSRWRGAPPTGTALFECISTQRPVVRDSPDDIGAFRQAGLPAALQRQIVMPLLEGGRLAGALLVADAAKPYDDDDRRHLAHVADAGGKLLKRRRSDAEVISAMDQMERVMFGAIEALAHLAETQDAGKAGRARRVAERAASIGTHLGLPGHAVRGLRVMAQLLDVGMLQIPRELLWRPGALTPIEFELVKSHVERGFELLRDIEFPWPVAEAVRQHHERLDGSGYPRGLKGDDILLEARILAVADAVEAMLSPRPHRPALSAGACIEELQSQAGRRYDARVVKAGVKLLREGLAPVTGTIHQDGETPGQRIA